MTEGYAYSRAIPTAYGVLALLLSLYQARQSYRDAFNSGWDNLVKTVVQDQAMYFIA